MRSVSGPAIKICGIKTAEALEATIAAHADHAGFNFHPPSPRFLSVIEAADLTHQAQGRIERVGLFVDAADSTIAEVLAAVRLDALQLQGSETPERVAQLRNQFGLPVWKAISVASTADVTRAAAFVGAADLILFDAKTPKGTLPGGMGLVFDWSLLAEWKAPCAWGLAGGLNTGNVGAAIVATKAPLLDVCSGVESAPGTKDLDRIKAFCAVVRAR
jgi:phosphoribosylanthranilate isomerase